jgi:hypothetical protein
MVKLFLQYVSGVIVAFILGICVWYLCYFFAIWTGVTFINIPAIVYLITFLAWPLGCSLGMCFVEKLIYKSTIYSAWKILVGFLTSLFGVVLFMLILPFFGIYMYYWVPLIHGVYYGDYLYPFIAAFFTLIGYNSIRLFAPPKESNQTKTNEKPEELSKEKWRAFVEQKLPIIILLALSLLIFLIIVCRSGTYRM